MAKIQDYLKVGAKGFVTGIPGMLMTWILYSITHSLGKPVLMYLSVIIGFVITLISFGYFATTWWNWK